MDSSTLKLRDYNELGIKRIESNRLVLSLSKLSFALNISNGRQREAIGHIVTVGAAGFEPAAT